MKNKTIAIQGDSLKILNPKTDTTIFLAIEAQKNNKIFYYEPKDLYIKNKDIFAKGAFVKFNYLSNSYFKILNKQILKLEEADIILIRQDPPFNLEYITTTHILEKLKKPNIINNPTAIRNISEKLYSTLFAKYMPNTIFTSNLDEICKFIEINKKVVIKPIYGFGGNNIHLVTNKTSKSTLKKIVGKRGHLMCQKFLPGIKKGDKRVFILNGKVRGAISRVPKDGSFLSNISKGAIAKITKINKKEMKICREIGRDLKKNNIFFSGIDFISGKLNGDINVTSPTGIKTYFDLTGINLAKIFWNEL